MLLDQQKGEGYELQGSKHIKRDEYNQKIVTIIVA